MAWHFIFTPQSFICHISFAGTLIVSTIYEYVSAPDYWAFILTYSILYLALSFTFLSFYDEKSIDDDDEQRTLSGYYSEMDTTQIIEQQQPFDDIEKEQDEDKDEEKEIELIETKQSTQSSKPSQFQLNKMKEILSQYPDFFQSPDYLNLIPNDPNWINRPLKLKNATRSQHNTMLDSFIIPDEPFKYKSDIEEAMKLFHKWRKWKNGIDWKQKAKKEDMTIYSHSIPNEPIDIIKGEGAIFPYSTPIVLGVLLNVFHRKQWDAKLDKIKKFERCSHYSALVYISVNTPTPFIADRDVCVVTFVYPFEDGSVVMGSKSINHSDYPPNVNDKVRMTVYGDFWYITPDFENNLQHTKITLYSHLSLGGNMPNWLINQASTDIPDSILKVREYMKTAYATLHEKGSLHIPPFPCLKAMGVDIGWMDSNKDKEEKVMNVEEMEKDLFEYEDVSVMNDTQEVVSLLGRLSSDMDRALQDLADMNKDL